MKSDRTKTIITGVSILLITTGLFFVGRAILRRLQENKEDDLADIAGDEGSGDTQLTPSEEQEAKNYNPTNDVKYIFDKIGGYNFIAPYKEINGRICDTCKFRKVGPQQLLMTGDIDGWTKCHKKHRLGKHF